MRSSIIAMAVSASLCAEAEGQSAAAASGKRFAKKEYDLDTGEFVVEFNNGTSASVNVDQLPEEIRRKLMFHGIAQKVGDSYAGAKGNASIALNSANEVIEQLKQGEWKSTGDGEARPRLGELAEALARVKGVPQEEALQAVTLAAALDGDDAAKKAGAEKLRAWRAHPKVKLALAEIRTEKARKELEAAASSAEVPSL